MKIALYGGTFDPPHRAHQRVAEAALEEFVLDEVWWIPCAVPPHKAAGRITPFADRFAMVQLVAAENLAFRALDIERNRGGPSYTIDTLEQLTHAHRSDTLMLLMGEDSLRQFDSWRAPERIAALASLIVYGRGMPDAEPLAPYLSGRVQYCSAPPINLSGTSLRRRLRSNAAVDHLLSEPVRAYIKTRGLYQSAQ